MAGGIPIIRVLRESLRGEPIRRVMGIVNGTTNYILTKMTEEGADYGAALGRGPAARATPSVTPPPTSRASTPPPRPRSSPPSPSGRGSWPATCTTRASAASPPDDIAVARRLGYVVKLLAICERVDGPTASDRRAGPPGDGAAGTTRWRACATATTPSFVEGGAVGDLMFYGRGAGGRPTASAVLGDLIDAAVNLRQGTHGPMGTFPRARMRPIDETTAEYYLPLEVVDRPGVLHAVTGVFAKPRREHPHAWSRRARATTPGSCSSPTRRGRPTCRRRCATSATSRW